MAAQQLQPGEGNPDGYMALLSPTDDELELVDAFVEAYPRFKELTPAKCLRFLRARRRDFEKTASMLDFNLEYIARVSPSTLTDGDVNQAAIQCGTLRYLGPSEDGCPVVWVQAAPWNPHEYDIDEFELVIAFFTQRIEEQMINNKEEIILFDVSGWQYWHAKYLSYLKVFIDALQCHYPGRMKKAVLLNSPYLFSAVWSGISSWLDAVVASKVVFASGEEAIAAVVEELKIPLDILPGRYGGAIIDDEALPVPGFPTAPGK